MREKFLRWCQDCGIEAGEDWTVEQLCDAIVSSGSKWPTELTNEQGWQLWTAVLRRELNVQSVQWIEEDDQSNFNVLFRLADKRQFSVEVSRKRIVEEDFGSICKTLEDSLREWKADDDREREAQLEREDAEYQSRIPDCMDYVIGFRAWNVSGNRIKPIGMGNDIWEGGQEVRATCAHGAIHRAPDPACECGLYAWNDWRGVSANRNDSQVYGAVRAWGRMQVHHTGFRAEFMQPVLLGYDDSEDRLEGALITGMEDAELSDVLEALAKRTLPPATLVRGPDFKRVSAISKHLGDIPVVPYSVMERAASDFGLIVGDNPHLLPEG